MVEWTGLENQRWGNSSVSSNLTASANHTKRIRIHGGIGRRKGLKIPRTQVRPGSIPGGCTKIQNPARFRILQGFFIRGHGPLLTGGIGNTASLIPRRGRAMPGPMPVRDYSSVGLASGAWGPPWASMPPMAFIDKRKRPLSSASITFTRTV